MFVLALVLGAFFSFAAIIIRSLDAQRTIRSEAGRKALLTAGATGSFSSASANDEVEIDPLPAKFIFGTDTVNITEETHMPNMKL